MNADKTKLGLLPSPCIAVRSDLHGLPAGLPMLCTLMARTTAGSSVLLRPHFCYVEFVPVLEPVIWAKGTVLNPQHLQIQDRFLADSLQFHLQALNFRPWGFQRLRIDQQAMSTGTLTLSEASGILADGLLFDIPNSDPA